MGTKPTLSGIIENQLTVKRKTCLKKKLEEPATEGFISAPCVKNFL